MSLGKGAESGAQALGAKPQMLPQGGTTIELGHPKIPAEDAAGGDKGS